MPKVISPEIKEKILHLSKNNYLRQGEIAKMCGVSRMLVNSIVNKRPLKRTRPMSKGSVCPITGYKMN